MKRTRMSLVAVLAGGALALAPTLTAAYADDVPPEEIVVETPVEEVLPPEEIVPEEVTPEEEVIDETPSAARVAPNTIEEVDPTPYVLVAWIIPSGDSAHPWTPGPQIYKDHRNLETEDLSALDDQLGQCGVSYQVDLYNDSDVTTALLLAAKLYGPSNPQEDLAYNAVQGNPWKFIDNEDCPPVLNEVCETVSPGTHSTDLNDLWADVDTRSKGHSAYVNDGLHVWTDDNSSQAKVSEGISVLFPLSETGELVIDASAQLGNDFPYGPGLNLFVDITGDNVADGTLVYEPVYGQDLWVTNGSAQALKDAAVHTGGNGSENHGTINQFLLTFPEANVVGLAYSLGSGVHGDWVINSITANCLEHTFDVVDTVEIPEPSQETVTTYGEFGGAEPSCENPTVTWTRQSISTTTTTSWTVEVREGRYELVRHILAGLPVVLTDELTETHEYDGECTTVVTQTPPPSPPEKVLATTGANDIIWLAILIAVALLLMGAVVYFVDRVKKNRNQHS